MSWDRFRETGMLDKTDNPSTDDWIGNIDTDMMDAKIAEFEKMREADDWEQLDANTIDTFFLHKVRNSDGTEINPVEGAYVCPLSNQEDSYGKLYPDAWKSSSIPHGTILYQIGENEETKSSYFTDFETVDLCRDSETGIVDLNMLKSKLQINDDANIKKCLTAYMVMNPNGLKAAEGFALANEQEGEGGGRQYFIPYANDYKLNAAKGLAKLDNQFSENREE